MVLGCLIVLLCSAGATAVAVVDEVHTLADALSQGQALNLGSGALANAGWGDPETLLLVGNDQRNHTTTTPVLPHSNEMLLVRFDPSKPYISMMSIPRELMVTIQCPNGPATTRLNYALTCGGFTTLVSTIKQLTGIEVNHVVEIDFNNFKRAVNEMGCVYSTVDRRYYNLNIGTPETDYQNIDLQPGYQKMCGDQALQFVSYRHGDTSLVRDARDQDFLLDVKREYGPTLVDNLHKFEQIFGQTVQTDPGLRSYSGIVNLLGTLISSQSLRVRQVQFQVNLEPTGSNPCSCDTATPQQIADSVHAFLYGGSAVPKQSTAKTAHAVHSKTAIATLPLVPVPSSELAQAHAFATGFPFTMEYPRVQDAGGSGVPVFLRNYLIHAPGGTAYPAYVAVFDTGQLGQYYDVQGTTWTTPPQLDSPDQTVNVGGRTYYLFYSGQHVQTVAWYAHGAAYWIHNSLTDVVGNGEMLAIAEQTVPVAVSAADVGRARVSLRAAGVPLRPSPQSTTSTRQTIGGLAGVLTLLALPLLAFLGIRRILDLRRARVQLEATQQVGTRMPSFAAGPVPAPGAAVGRVPSYPAATSYRPAAAGAPRRWSEPRTYSRSRLRRPVTIVALAVIVAAAGAAAYVLTSGRHASATRTPRRTAAARKAATIPTVPVAVLNATSTPGAAHQLAVALQAYRVRISEVGNVTETRPPGTEVLYAPGERVQAERVARLLAGHSPTVAPIDPVTAGAAGSGAQVVVVIT